MVNHVAYIFILSNRCTLLILLFYDIPLYKSCCDEITRNTIVKLSGYMVTGMENANNLTE